MGEWAIAGLWTLNYSIIDAYHDSGGRLPAASAVTGIVDGAMTAKPMTSIPKRQSLLARRRHRLILFTISSIALNTPQGQFAALLRWILTEMNQI